MENNININKYYNIISTIKIINLLLKYLKKKAMTMYEFVSLDKSPSFYRQKDKKKGGDVSGSRINTESEYKILFLQT